jgi:hypothetical protein
MAVHPLPDRPPDLELDDDEPFQLREARFQRVGSAVLVAFVIAALAGLFGSGPLSDATAEVPGGLRVEYRRLAQYETPDSLTIRLPAADATRPERRVWLDRHYLEDVRVEGVTPLPQRVEATDRGSVYVFPVAPGHPLVVTFQMQPERLGVVRGAVGVDRADGEGPSVAFRQLVWP